MTCWSSVRSAARAYSLISPVPLQDAVMWADLQVWRLSSCRLVVLVNDAAEYLPALHGCVQRHDGQLVMVRWSLLPGLVRRCWL